MNKNVQFTKIKNPKREFLCALCSAPRQMRYSKNLSQTNYLQIIITAIFTTWLLYPLMGLNSLFSLFFVWMSFEITNKFLYRKEITCPYCGFDATWYRRDVKLARKKVEEFWSLKASSTESSKNVSPSTAANS